MSDLLKDKKVLVYNAGYTGQFKYCKIKKLPTTAKHQKIYREFDPKKEKEIVKNLSLVSGNIVIDDCYSIFRGGVSPIWLNLISRINHNAKGKGANLYLVFHNFSQVNRCLLDYVTDFLIFKSDSINVDFRRDLGERLSKKLKSVVTRLEKSPKYSRAHIDITK